MINLRMPKVSEIDRVVCNFLDTTTQYFTNSKCSTTYLVIVYYRARPAACDAAAALPDCMQEN